MQHRRWCCMKISLQTRHWAYAPKGMRTLLQTACQRRGRCNALMLTGCRLLVDTFGALTRCAPRKARTVTVRTRRAHVASCRLAMRGGEVVYVGKSDRQIVAVYASPRRRPERWQRPCCMLEHARSDARQRANGVVPAPAGRSAPSVGAGLQTAILAKVAAREFP
jgi:hypothetical protein